MRAGLFIILCFFSSFSGAQTKCENQAIVEARLFLAQENQVILRYVVAESLALESDSGSVLNYLITMVDDSVIRVVLQKSDCRRISTEIVPDL